VKVGFGVCVSVEIVLVEVLFTTVLVGDNRSLLCVGLHAVNSRINIPAREKKNLAESRGLDMETEIARLLIG
jgi:hypothetical protein